MWMRASIDSDSSGVNSTLVLARHEYQARYEAVERVAPHEQTRALPLLQPQDAKRDVVQRLAVDLEQLVARILFEDRHQRLGQMPLGQEARPPDHAGNLAPHQRDVLGRHHVDVGRVQPEKTPLTTHTPLGVEQLDADIVEIAGPVHGGA
jgi:hypothetical protein